MPAELDYSKGRAAILSVGQTPWHREGVVLEKPPRSTAEALQLAGLDFDVRLEPVYGGTAHLRKRYVAIPDFRAVRRTDSGAILGVVRRRYTPLQNRDAFRILEPLLDRGVATIETAGALREGRDVWMLVRFKLDEPMVQEVFASDVVPFGLLSNNHAGERRVVLQETPIRVVCSNTLGMALSGPGEKLGVRHTVNVELKTVEAAQALWGALIERYRSIAEQYRQLKATFLDEALFRELVLDTVAPLPAKVRDGTPSRRTIEQSEARRRRITDLWTNGAGHCGDHSAWEAYNAVAQSLDHDQQLWQTRRSRTASLFDGHLGRAKREALDALVAHAQANAVATQIDRGT